ncbi:MAG: cellulase family glycosylhydrolase [Candidatus Electrothrix scaldis]|nr:MAG: cellulase family glycosylhydrolase [Candidatus Electrothrix sp. GW3-3]
MPQKQIHTGLPRVILLHCLFLLVSLLIRIGTAAATPINLLGNPGAESGTASWYTFGGGPVLQVSSAQAHSDGFSFFSTGRTQFYHGPAYDITSLITGDQILADERSTASVWVYHSESGDQALHLNYKIQDGSGTHYYTIENETVPPNTWVKIVGHIFFNIPSSITRGELYIVSDSGTTFDFYADDFFLGVTEDYDPPTSSTPNNTAQDFIRASGRNLLAPGGDKNIVLQGINLTVPADSTDTAQDIWDTKSLALEDFTRIADMGFNAVRLHLNYITFEEDDNPGVFKEDGWHWLDRVLSFARQTGLYVMLDMHRPQGGYQSDKTQGFSAFWDGNGAAPNTANQDRLIALWQAIADRYKYETAILGYDLINEPRPNNTTEWIGLAEQIIAAIRAVDPNHMIVLEVPFIPGYIMTTVTDSNVLYDSHFYYPWDYSIQYSAAYGKAGQLWGKYDPADPVYLDSSYEIVPEGTAGAKAFNKANLAEVLAGEILEFAAANNVPVDVGEFGIVWEAFAEDVGAIPYLRDLYAVFKGENEQGMQVGSFYFSYQGNTFGLYNNWSGFQPGASHLNEPLKDFFQEVFSKKIALAPILMLLL